MIAQGHAKAKRKQLSPRRKKYAVNHGSQYLSQWDLADIVSQDQIKAELLKVMLISF